LERKAEPKEFNPYPRGGHHPKEVCSGSRRDEVKLTQLTKLLFAKEATGKRHAWGLKFDWIDRCEEAMLGGRDSVRFRMSQGQDGIDNFFFYLVDK